MTTICTHKDFKLEIRLTVDQKATLKNEAKKRNETMSGLMMTAIEWYLIEHGSPDTISHKQ